MAFGKKYAWLQMVMWLGIDQWAWNMNIWHIINRYMGYMYIQWTTAVWDSDNWMGQLPKPSLSHTPYYGTNSFPAPPPTQIAIENGIFLHITPALYLIITKKKYVSVCLGFININILFYKSINNYHIFVSKRQSSYPILFPALLMDEILL